MSAELQTPQSQWLTPSSTPCVRVLLAIDVPPAILPEIRADWARVAASKLSARDSMPAAVGWALGRLQRHFLDVTGAAVVESPENPLAPWQRRRARASQRSRLDAAAA